MRPVWLDEPECRDAARFGNKAAILARLSGRYRVPPGFCLPAESACEMNTDLIGAAYRQMGQCAVAVRSSAIGEDSADASFAGQHETFLNVRGLAPLIDSIARCAASGNTARAQMYRARMTACLPKPAVAVLIQQMVLADASAVVFTAHPATGNARQIVITSNWGLCESIVSGWCSPDTFVLEKDTLAIGSCEIGEKSVMAIASGDGVKQASTPRILRRELSLSDMQLKEAAQLALQLENETGSPVDIECAWAGGELYLLQCRPITTLRKDDGHDD